MVDINPEYKRFVDDANTNDKNKFISNDAVEHAIYISKLLIDRANNNTPIKVFTGELEEIFYNDSIIRLSLENARKRNASIQIIIEQESENREFLEFCKKNDIKINAFKKSLSELGITRKLGHFLLVGSAFRLEKLHTPEDFRNAKFRIKGNVNFNNPEFAQDISSVFDTLLELSERV